MKNDLLTLPEGRSGQVLAIGISSAILLATLSITVPAFNWYQQRQDMLSLKQQAVTHIIQALPLLPLYQQEIITLNAGSRNQHVLLAGSSDAIAGANLQSEIVSLTRQTGAGVASIAMLPVQSMAGLRRISIEVDATATWPQLIALLGLIETARPRMILSNLNIENLNQTEDDKQENPLDVSFLISGFSDGGA